MPVTHLIDAVWLGAGRSRTTEWMPRTQLPPVMATDRMSPTDAGNLENPPNFYATRLVADLASETFQMEFALVNAVSEMVTLA